MHALRQKLHDTRVGRAIALLIHEGVPQPQAVAKAMAMEHAKRLREDGSYRHVGEAK